MKPGVFLCFSQEIWVPGSLLLYLGIVINCQLVYEQLLRKFHVIFSSNLFVCSIVEYAIDTQNLNLSAIRTIRVLRPLRAINRIPSEYRAVC